VTSTLATILFIMLRCNIDREGALHRMPAACGNQLMACYWIEQGREVETMTGAAKRATAAQKAFEGMSKRKHNFNIE
jgi:hypothetical protein